MQTKERKSYNSGHEGHVAKVGFDIIFLFWVNAMVMHLTMDQGNILYIISIVNISSNISTLIWMFTKI